MIIARRLLATAATPTVVRETTLRPGHELDIIVEDPSSLVALTLEAIHAASGLPWYVVVPSVAVAVRALSQSLLVLHRRRTQALLGPLRGELGRLGAELSEALRQKPRRWIAVQEWARSRHAVLRRCEAGHVSRNIWAYTYAAMAVAHVAGLRYALLIDPSFAAEGALWFSNLAAHDQLLRLPAIACALSLASLGPRPPPRSLARVGHGAAAVAVLALLPLAHWVCMPEAIALHLAGVAACRLALMPRRSGRSPPAAPSRNPRWQ